MTFWPVGEGVVVARVAALYFVLTWNYHAGPFITNAGNWSDNPLTGWSTWAEMYVGSNYGLIARLGFCDGRTDDNQTHSIVRLAALLPVFEPRLHRYSALAPVFIWRALLTYLATDWVMRSDQARRVCGFIRDFSVFFVNQLVIE